jgi:ABC-type lipoprotein export system ATPase subunit
MLDPAGKRLPGSVIHKLLLVRALAGKPRLLLLEEPWMNSENGYRRQIIQLLSEIKNTTVIVVSSDEEFATQCDKVITMIDGQIAISDTSKK